MRLLTIRNEPANRAVNIATTTVWNGNSGTFVEVVAEELVELTDVEEVVEEVVSELLVVVLLVVVLLVVELDEVLVVEEEELVVLLEVAEEAHEKVAVLKTTGP